LIHELGHALMIRRYGRDAYIVLYGMGGLAIEGTNDPYKFSYNPRGERRTAQEQIYISLAGPGAQFILAGILLVFAKAMKGDPHLIFLHGIVPMVTVEESAQITPQLATLLFIAFQVNIGWALMNLLPVFPLDGGQIAMQLLMLRDSYGGMVRALQLSIGVAIVVALFALVTMRGEGWYPALLFGSLAYSNYMSLAQIHGRGGGSEW
jgi:Zn-dependent protease